MDVAAPPLQAKPLAQLIGPAAATCTDCQWGRNGMGEREWLMIRAAALRHVRSKAHTVVANVGHLYTYGAV